MIKTNRQDGFTIIEVMIAMAILAIGILGVAKMQTTSTSGNASARGYTEATAVAQQQLERLLSLNYKHADLLDQDGDGIPGLGNNTTGAGDASDSDFAVSVGLYNVFWNIAEEQPIAGSKRIRLFVQWNTSGSGPRELVFNCIKANI